MKTWEKNQCRKPTALELTAHFKAWWDLARVYIDPTMDYYAYLSKWGLACKGAKYADNETPIVPAFVTMLDDTDPDLEPVIDAKIETAIGVRRKYNDSPIEELRRQVAFQVCVAVGVVTNNARNAAVVRTAIQHADNSTLILVPTVEHGQALAEKTPGSVVCFSKMGKRPRREAVGRFRSGDLRCLIATSLADEGLDVPCADVLILTSAGRSKARGEQRTGRVLRTHGGKTRGTIYDFVDRQHPLLAYQSRRRQDLYRELGYHVEFAAQGGNQ